MADDGGKSVQEQWAEAQALGTQQRAAGNSAASAGVSPDTAATALRNAPVTGVPAASAMVTPQENNDLAAQYREAQGISSHPAIAGLAASDPAHWAVARDDTDALHHTASLMDTMFPQGAATPLHDIATAFGSEWGNLQTLAQQHPGVVAGLGIWAPLYAAGTLGATPLAAVQEPAVRAIGSIPGAAVTSPLFPWEQPRILTSTSDKEQNARNVLNSATFLLGLAAGGERGIKGPKAAAPVEPPAPSGPAVGGPFNTPREAAQWVRENSGGNAAGFEVRNVQAESGPTAYYVHETPPVVPPVDGVPPVGVHPGVDAVRGAVAGLDAEHISAVQESIAQGKVLGRSPEVMEGFLRQWPGAEVSVDPEHLVQLAQGREVVFPDHFAETANALQDGTDVRVPLSTYLTATAGKPYAQELNATSTFREGGVSVEEGKSAVPPQGESAPQSASVEVAPHVDLSPEEDTRYRDLAARADQQIQEIVRAQYLAPLGSAKALGLPKEMFDRYSIGIENAVLEARDRMHAKAYAQVLRERTPEWKAEVASNAEKLVPQIEALPVIRAHRALSQPGFKLDRGDVESFFPEPASRLRKEVLKNGGNHPDAAADILGYDSGAQLISDLADLHSAIAASGAKNLNEYVKLQARGGAEAAARDRLDFDLSPEGIHAAASELVNAPSLLDHLDAELKTFAEEHNLPFEVGDLKSIAAQRFAARTVSVAKNVRMMEKFIGKAWGKVEKALAKQDFTRAFLWRQKQVLLQHELALAHKFNKVFTRDQTRFNRWARKDLIKGVEPEWSAHILQTLRETGYPVKRADAELASDLKGADGQPVSLEKFLTAKAALGTDLQYVPVPTGPVNDMTVGNYAGLSDMLNSMAHAGRREQTVGREEARIELAVATKRAVSQLEARGKEPITREQLEHPNAFDVMENARRSVDAWGTRPEQLRTDLDQGDPNGVFNEIVTLPLQARKTWRDESMRLVMKHVHDLTKGLDKKFPKWLKARVTEPGFVDANGDRFFSRKSDVVGAALHWENADNRARLIEGLNYGKPEGTVTEAEVAELLTRHMTPDAWKYAHGLQKMFAHFKADMFSMYKRINGISPPDVGEHYYPITRDPRYLPEGFENEMQFAGDGNYYRATPSNPHAKERTGATYPLSLNLDIASRRIFQVVHDIAFREVLMDAQKFLGARNVQNAIARHYGPEYGKGMLGWLQSVAADLSFNARDSQAVKDMLDWTNEGMIIDMIGYSAHTVMLHGPTALVQSMQTVGPGRFIATLAEMLAKPRLWGEVWNESPEIRNRIMNSSEGAREAFLKMYGKKGFINQLQLYSMYGVSMSDQFSAMPTYLAAKRAFLADPRTAANAQALAEQQVRQAHGSAGVTEAPAALRGNQSIAGKAWKNANQFLTFWNHMYNRQREIGQNLGFAGNKRDFPKAMAGFFSYIIAVGVIHHEVEKLYGRKSNGALDVAMTPFMGLPYLNAIPTVADLTHHDVNTDAFHTMMKNMGGVVKDAEHLFEGKPVSQRWIQHIANTAGFVAHLPGNQLGKTLAGLHDLQLRGSFTPLEAIKEIVEGPPDTQHTSTHFRAPSWRHRQ